MADFRAYEEQTPEWKQLQRFVIAVRQLLSEVRDKHPHLVLKERVDDMGAAIGRTSDRIKALIETISETRVSEAIQRGDTHGLTKAELRFKLNNIFHFWQRFSISSLPEHLRKLIDAILTLLKSLLEALGGDIAISETIEGISDIIAD